MADLERKFVVTSYGNPSTGPEDYPANSAPVHFGAHQRVGITPSGIEYAPEFGLFYNQEEFADVIEPYCKDFRNPLLLTAEVKSY